MEKNRDLYGETITKGQEDSILKRFMNPLSILFTIILLVIVISLVTNVWLAKPGQEDPTTSIIIVVLVTHFWWHTLLQEPP